MMLEVVVWWRWGCLGMFVEGGNDDASYVDGGGGGGSGVVFIFNSTNLYH
jgi:hypothetical protein